jgi:hypothetical protein
MGIGAPPLEVSYQVWGLLRRRPSATSQGGYCMPDGQIHPLDKSGVQPSGERLFRRRADEEASMLDAYLADHLSKSLECDMISVSLPCEGDKRAGVLWRLRDVKPV